MHLVRRMRAQMVTCVRALSADSLVVTFQFPNEFLISEEPAEIKYLTPKHYHLATAPELIEKAAVAHEHSADDVSDLKRFKALMLEKPMCLWGHCYTQPSQSA